MVPAWPLVLAFALCATPGARAQPTAAAQRRDSSALDAPAALMDVNRIDPLTFRAMAARVPDGQTPRIDGHLTDPAWDQAPASGRFIQREPHLGAPASEWTEFRVLYDDRRIYFGVWAFDADPDGIQASEMKRDSGLNKGDRIAIVIDTFFDRRNGFYFATNPLGAYKDAQYTDNARVRNNDWNAVWQCRTSRDEKGWYAEIAIPLSQLRFNKRLGESTWGLNVARSIIRRHEDTYWVPYPREQGANGFAYLSNAGVLEGLTDLDAPHRLEFVPFVAPQFGRDLDAGSSLTDLDRYGFDARIGLTSTMLADVTYRTDFAQVEADQEVVNVTRFSLFFPEKRQFFTESAGLFNYGKPGVETGLFGPGLLPLFYSRRIGLYEGREVPILAGGRVAGRSGRYSLGFMNIETDQTHEGTIESQTADGDVAITFNDTSVLSARVSRDYDLLTDPFRLGAGVVEPGGYRWNTGRVAYSSNPRLRVTGGGSVETGGYYSGDKTTVSASLSVLPTETLLVEMSVNRNDIEVPSSPRYVTNTVSTRVSYSFSPTLFAKGYIQFNDERKLASLNLLFWAIYRPGSDFYIVYNQGWHTDLPGPHANQAKDRSLAVKLTYWFSR